MTEFSQQRIKHFFADHLHFPKLNRLFFALVVKSSKEVLAETVN